MKSIRALHMVADEARAYYWLWLSAQSKLSREEIRRRYEAMGEAEHTRDVACKRLDFALVRYDEEKSTENYDELVAAVVACYTTDQDPLTDTDESHAQ